MSTVAQLITTLARDFEPGDHVAILVPSAEDPADLDGAQMLEIAGMIGLDAGAINEDGAVQVRVAALVFDRTLSEAIQAQGHVETEVMTEGDEP